MIILMCGVSASFFFIFFIAIYHLLYFKVDGMLNDSQTNALHANDRRIWDTWENKKKDCWVWTDVVSSINEQLSELFLVTSTQELKKWSVMVADWHVMCILKTVQACGTQ